MQEVRKLGELAGHLDGVVLDDDVDGGRALEGHHLPDIVLDLGGKVGEDVEVDEGLARTVERWGGGSACGGGFLGLGEGVLGELVPGFALWLGGHLLESPAALGSHWGLSWSTHRSCWLLLWWWLSL